jgi:hypothetical protein
MHISRIPFALVLGCVVAFAATPAAKAGTITYAYTGNDFTTTDLPYTTSDFVSASFGLGSPLSDNLDDADETSAIVSWNISDGVDDLNAANASLAGFDVTTDGSGDITAWNFVALDLTSFVEIASVNGITNNGIPIYDEALDSYSETENYGNAGTWAETTVASTPEPSTTVLVSLGGALLLIGMKRKHWHG